MLRLVRGGVVGDRSAGAGDRDSDDEVGMVYDLPEGWQPPTALARQLLALILSAAERRRGGEAA
jgi:hypothetical protein